MLCLDHGSWRTEIFPTYKANRPPKPEAAVLEFARVKADLARRYPCASAANYEADDIMATLARIPAVGDQLEIEDGVLRVERMDGRRIDRVRFTPNNLEGIESAVEEAREEAENGR